MRITVSITIIVITVNLDLAFCVVSVRGGSALCGVRLRAASGCRAQTLQIVNGLCDEGMRKGRFWRHSNVDLPLDAFLHRKTVN